MTVVDASASPLSGIDVDDVDRAYEHRHLADWSDDALAAAAAEVIAVPKVIEADSFVLHAPLELLARRGLLDHVVPERREDARRRLVWLAATYEAAGEPLPAGRPDPSATAGDAAWRLAGAIAAGDLDDVDAAAVTLARLAPPDDLARLLAPSVVTSLAAAAHASILLDLLPRVAGGRLPSALVRGPARELARNADWQLRWFEDPDDRHDGDLPVDRHDGDLPVDRHDGDLPVDRHDGDLPVDRHDGDLPVDRVVGGSLADALLDVPALGPPGSNFIRPIMSQAEDSGLAPRLLGGLLGGDPAAVGRDLARVAAWSMVQEPTDHAPYGWTHCLTMPQAVMALATGGAYPYAQIATGVAATYVVGFRAALGTVTLDPGWAPERPAAETLDEALAGGPDDAAAWAWHAGPAEVATLPCELAGRAAAHHDAHLVKYTLACLDAASNDAEETRLYLAACARLHAWWRAADGHVATSP